jgi:uncharacterized protein with NAD-binding domain and iron-sulfur cluster
MAWKFQAGCAGPHLLLSDVHCTQERVKFEFFNKVLNLSPSKDSNAIDEINTHIQATEIAGPGKYDPFMTVNEIPCWPKKPHYYQLKEGDKLREDDYRLDSYWTEWPGAETKTLKRGTDFTYVLLRIPVSVLKEITPKLMEKSSKWAKMVNTIQSVRTQAIQRKMLLLPSILRYKRSILR